MARLIVVDETGMVSQSADRLVAALEMELIWTRTIADLPAVLAKSGRHDVLVVNLPGRPRAWSLAQRVRGGAFEGRLLVFVDDWTHADVTAIMEIPRAVCVPRPATVPELSAVLQRLVAGMLAGRGTPRPVAPHGIVGGSARMRDVFAQVAKVATNDVTVCITGESGTGKELVAGAIHAASARRNQPFVTLDCTTIPEGLIESHLFGHVKGAFTGAVGQRQGVFELAHRGTVFIDELAELPLALQAKLLRVIQTREVAKVGGTTPFRADVRLVTATNRRLEQAVEQKAFREDLYYRVSVVTIRMPPLRERWDDIPALVEHFCTKFSAAYRKRVRGVAPAALRRLLAHDWPGNVRELENLVERAFVLTESETLAERDLFGDDGPPAEDQPARAARPPGDSLRAVEKAHILGTLDRVGGNRTEAARMLGISLRGLQYKLKAYIAEGERPPSATRLRRVRA